MRRATTAAAATLFAIIGATSASADITLTFDTPVPGTIADKNGLGTGFTVRLPGTGAALPAQDPNMDLLSSPGHLLLTSTQADINQTGHSNLPQLEAPGLFLQNAGGKDLILSTRVLGISVPVSSDQVLLYAGDSATSVVRSGFHAGNRYYVIANQGSGDSILFDSGTGAFTTGDDVVLSFGRTNGLWSLSWQDTTNPHRSGSSPGMNIPFLTAKNDLYVGLIASNPSTAAFTNSFDYFSATGPAASTVPEPSSFLLTVVGVLGAAVWRWSNKAFR
jgi:hypothetical protein